MGSGPVLLETLHFVNIQAVVQTPWPPLPLDPRMVWNQIGSDKILGLIDLDLVTLLMLFLKGVFEKTDFDK